MSADDGIITSLGRAIPSRERRKTKSTDAKPRAESTDAKPRAESSLLGFAEARRRKTKSSLLGYAECS
ncbi:MAG: hypothetical protein PUD32_10385 [Bacteroidales bacterium]|nr:hypothetical protein [Bacteroidales bacterium]